MLIEELEKNQRMWQDTVDSLAEVAERCRRAALADWASTSADRFREDLAGRTAEVLRLQELAAEVIDAYARHVAAVRSSVPSDSLIL